MIFDPKKETFTNFHLPYPMPFYTRGLDGRIDDPRAGWKGRGVWATYSSYSEGRLAFLRCLLLRFLDAIASALRWSILNCQGRELSFGYKQQDPAPSEFVLA
jgi:hypothetical protein